MATIYVSAVDGVNTDDGSTWALAKQTVAGALAIAANGDIILVDNAGTGFIAGAAITWTIPSNADIAIISVNRSTGAWATGAIESVGASSNAFTISGSNSNVFIYGMNIYSGTSASSSCDIVLNGATTGQINITAESCNFYIQTTNTGANLVFGPLTGAAGTRPATINLNNCTFRIANRGGTWWNITNSNLTIRNATFSFDGATKPGTLLSSHITSQENSRILITDSDLSNFDAASSSFFDVSGMNGTQIIMQRCKISATPNITTGTWVIGGAASVTLVQVDSGDTINVFEYRTRYGTLIENTSIYAASGASFNGSAISWQVVTTADCNEFEPFILPMIRYWNTATTSKTFAVNFVWDSATGLTDREIWLEFSYPSSTTFPTGSFTTDRNANPFTGSGATQTTNSITWTGTGGFANVSKQEVAVTVTPAEVGVVEGTVKIGKASTTLYLDPLLRAA